MQPPLVTIIVPTFNRLKWISICLDSIKSQTYPHVETLVIDDGSTDGTVAWLKSQPEYAFVRVHEQPKNGGASVARNDGIRLAQGELIAFIDSDDALLPNHIETAVNIFREYPNTGLFCNDSTIIGPDGEILFDGRTWHELQSEQRNLPVQTGFRSLSNIFEFSHIFPASPCPKRCLKRSALSSSQSFRWTIMTCRFASQALVTEFIIATSRSLCGVNTPVNVQAWRIRSIPVENRCARFMPRCSAIRNCGKTRRSSNAGWRRRRWNSR
jgi:glycosyltransferase involved in cell wall biosynthesis